MLSASDCLKVVGVLGQQRPEARLEVQARSVRKVSSASGSVGVRRGDGRPCGLEDRGRAGRPPTRPRRRPRTRRRGRRESATRSPEREPAAAARTRRRGRRAPAAPAGRGRPAPTAAARGRRRCGPSDRRPRWSPRRCPSATRAPGRATAAARPRRRTTPGCAASRPCRSRRPAAPCRTQRARRTAARAAGGPGRVDRVQRGAEDRVEGVRPGRELGHVGLADHHRAGAADPLDEQVVAVGDVVGEQRRAVRRPPAGHGVGVLERERQPVQRTDRAPGASALVGGRGAGPGAVLVERDDRVELRVALGDPGQVQVEQLARGDLAAAYGVGRVAGGRSVDSTIEVARSSPGPEPHRRPPTHPAEQTSPAPTRMPLRKSSLAETAAGFGGRGEHPAPAGRRRLAPARPTRGAPAAPVSTPSTLPKNSPAIRATPR